MLLNTSLSATELRAQIIARQYASIPFAFDQIEMDGVIQTLFAFFPFPMRQGNALRFILLRQIVMKSDTGFVPEKRALSIIVGIFITTLSPMNDFGLRVRTAQNLSPS